MSHGRFDQKLHSALEGVMFKLSNKYGGKVHKNYVGEVCRFSFPSNKRAISFALALPFFFSSKVIDNKVIVTESKTHSTSKHAKRINARAAKRKKPVKRKLGRLLRSGKDSFKPIKLKRRKKPKKRKTTFAKHIAKQRAAFLRPLPKKRKSNWIKKAVKHKGLLHRQLGVPKGTKIPLVLLRKAAKMRGKIGERARFALNVRGYKTKHLKPKR